VAAARTGPGMYGAAASSTGQRPGRGAICLPSTRIPCDGPAGCLRGCSSGMVRVCASQRPICVGLLGKRKAGAPAHACGTRTDTARLPRPASPRSAPSAPPPRAPPQGTKNCAVQSQPGAARGPAPPRRRAAGPHGRSEPPVPPAPPAPPFAAVRSPASARRAASPSADPLDWVRTEEHSEQFGTPVFFLLCRTTGSWTHICDASQSSSQHGATAREPPGGAGTRGRGGRVRLCGQLDTLPGDAPLPLLPALARRKRAAAGSALRTARAEHGLDRDGSPITAAVRGQRRCGAPDRVHVGSRRLARRGTRG